MADNGWRARVHTIQHHQTIVPASAMSVITPETVQRALDRAQCDVRTVDTALASIGSNVARYIASLPVHCHWREPLLAIAAHGGSSSSSSGGAPVPAMLVAALCNTSVRTVLRSKDARIDEFQRAHAAASDIEKPREYLDRVEHVGIIKYIHARCGPVSGATDHRGFQFGSDTHLYQQYNNDIVCIIYSIIMALIGEREWGACVLPVLQRDALRTEWNTGAHIDDANDWRHVIRSQRLIANITELIAHRVHYCDTIITSLPSVLTTEQRLQHSDARIHQIIIGYCDDAAYLPAWLAACTTVHARSRNTFLRVRRTINDIHHHQSTKSQFDCLICWDRNHPQNDDDMRIGEQHIKLVATQRTAYRNALVAAELIPLNAVIVVDWTSFNTAPNVGAQL